MSHVRLRLVLTQKTSWNFHFIVSLNLKLLFYISFHFMKNIFNSFLKLLKSALYIHAFMRTRFVQKWNKDLLEIIFFQTFQNFWFSKKFLNLIFYEFTFGGAVRHKYESYFSENNFLRRACIYAFYIKIITIIPSIVFSVEQRFSYTELAHVGNALTIPKSNWYYKLHIFRALISNNNQFDNPPPPPILDDQHLFTSENEDLEIRKRNRQNDIFASTLRKKADTNVGEKIAISKVRRNCQICFNEEAYLFCHDCLGYYCSVYFIFLKIW